MVAAERLAAVGKVAAGVAHEINNPLGGMINALDTLQTHGTPDKLTTKTVELVRRGLNQIRHTVGALLVEARLDASQMSPADWEDLRTPIEPEIPARNARSLWDRSEEHTSELQSQMRISSASFRMKQIQQI